MTDTDKADAPPRVELPPLRPARFTPTERVKLTCTLFAAGGVGGYMTFTTDRADNTAVQLIGWCIYLLFVFVVFWYVDTIRDNRRKRAGREMLVDVLAVNLERIHSEAFARVHDGMVVDPDGHVGQVNGVDIVVTADLDEETPIVATRYWGNFASPKPATSPLEGWTD